MGRVVPSRTTLGCVQIPSDVTLEDEGPPFAEQMGIDIQMTKVSFDSEDICAGTYLRAMQREELTKGAKTLAALAVSSGQKCDVLGLSCTSFSFTLGSAKVREQISAVTDMAQAQLEALKALQAKQVALLTPYIEELSQANAEMLESMGGFRVVSRLTMNLPTDDLTSAVPPAEIADWAVRTDSPQADVVVIGCSGFRACQPDFLDALEQRLGKPVVTSTQAFLWHMARSAGVQKKIKGSGLGVESTKMRISLSLLLLLQKTVRYVLAALQQCSELKDSDRHFIRSVTSALMQRMVEAGVIEKNDTKSHHPKHKGRILPNFNP
ncbi:unnamed protein product [Cladocopium goreaui]|uniref:Arylmalonate decarboxylase (AMDase) n=1 Tax=Cladocopium goreaui TaxID=2562237 RepID=A0A9P1BYT1_9DINO|nr:unnamed protein product [Cladocopium goreaui]